MTGSAGTVAFFHCRTIHSSGHNHLNSNRPLILFGYRACDAWPIFNDGNPHPEVDLENYDKKETLILSVGEKNEVSIKKVATEIAKSFNYEHMMEFDTRYADGQYKKTADNTKLMNLIGKFKFTTIEDGIKKNTKWFIENFDDARK